MTVVWMVKAIITFILRTLQSHHIGERFASDIQVIFLELAMITNIKLYWIAIVQKWKHLLKIQRIFFHYVRELGSVAFN